MNSFSKVAGIVRIIFFELMLLIFLGGFISNLAQDLEQHTVNSDLVYLITTCILGLGCLVYMIYSIIKPRLSNESGIVMSSVRSYSFNGFCSTHPSYIFIDAFILLGYALLFSEFTPTTTQEYYRMMSTWGFAIFIPTLRLFCWYILGIKYPSTQCEDAWKPVMWFYVIISPIALLFIIGMMCNA